MKSQSRITLSVLAACGILASLVGGAATAVPAKAGTYIGVNTNLDAVAVDGGCSLREAILAADSDAEVNECPAGSGADTIWFTAPFTITVTAPLQVVSQVDIWGRGITDTIIQASACDPVTLPGGCTPAGYGNIFHVLAPANASLHDLTVRHGNGGSGIRGGAVRNESTLHLIGVLITNNKSIDGGGVYGTYSSTTHIENSTFANNRAMAGVGGGLLLDGAATCQITGSTFKGNVSQALGGGIGMLGGSLSVANSTLWGNSALLAGGGICNLSSLNLYNVTLSNNSAPPTMGGGIFNAAAMTMANTIVANHPAGADDCYNGGVVAAQVANLIESDFPPPANCSSVLGPPIDPGLLPLGNYGGPTETMPIGAASPAYNTGDVDTCTSPAVGNVDQRGLRRYPAPCDIGAYELHTPPANDNFASATAVSTLPYTDSQFTVGATTEAAEPASSCASSPGYHSIWYAYTAPGNMDVTVSTIGSSYDTILEVWAGSPPSSSVTCSDDIGDVLGGTSRVRFKVSTGVTYYVEVTSYQYGGGNMQVNMVSTPESGDYDTGGHTDAALFERATGHWFAAGSGGLTNPALGFGNDANYIPVPADYDGDGTTDAAVFERATGNWFAVGSSAGFFTPALGFGNDANYIPVPGDYDGDLKADAAVYEKATGNWFVVSSYNGSLLMPALGFGNANFVPVPGYYDPDGRMDPAVYELATGNWFAVGSRSGFLTPALGFGGPLYRPVPGDYDGDNLTDAAVFEKATGNWFVVSSLSHSVLIPALGFGNDTAYIPVQGDYEADHKTDPAVFEKATGNWFVVGSATGFFAPALAFGNDTNYIPVSSPPR